MMPNHLSEQEASKILGFWSFSPNIIVQPTYRGTNNTTYFVHAPVGKFLLKFYGGSTPTAQIDYEHSLLSYLQEADLSFAVPTPIPASSGETLVHIHKDDALLRVALISLIPGQHAERHKLQHARASGRALGELHDALTDFDPIGTLAQLPAWGELHQIHPLVPNPLEVSSLLPLELSHQAHLRRTLIEVLEVMPRLYQTLPVQTIHADYLSFNTLLENNEVVGVLDFEFATRDLRLVDYICGLDDYAMFPWQTTSRWEFVEAFSAGYAESNSLSQPEVEALIMVWRLQRISSIVYWSGWLQEGKMTSQKLVNAVTDTLLFEDWLEQNKNELLSHIVGIA